MINGPIPCRHGIMHLKPANVKVIGGEVEELAAANSADAVLSAIL